MSYQDVRGPDGRKLFRFDPDRMLIEIVRRDVTYVVDLTQFQSQRPAVIEIDPLADLPGERPPRGDSSWVY